MLNARYYENGKYTGSRKRETIAQLMADHPQHEVSMEFGSSGLIAVLRDTRSTASVIRVYDSKLRKNIQWALSEES